MKTQTRLDTMNHAQRATFARKMYGHIRLDPKSVGTKLLLNRIAKGGTK